MIGRGPNVPLATRLAEALVGAERADVAPHLLMMAATYANMTGVSLADFLEAARQAADIAFRDRGHG